jgi:ethanolamine ammonia-lyase large subunit
MKNVLTIIVISISSFFCQDVPLSKVAVIDKPISAEKIERNDILAFGKRKFKNFYVSDNNNINYFKVGNILVSFWDVLEDETNNRNIDVKRKEITAVIKLVSTNIIDETKLIENNKRLFAIIKYHNGDEYYFTFFSEYLNHKGISGQVQFKKQDLEKATAIFDKFVKGVKFKK